MILPPRILRFLALTALLHAGLLLAWPILGPAHSALLRRGAEWAGNLGARHRFVSYRPEDGAGGWVDTRGRITWRHETLFRDRNGAIRSRLCDDEVGSTPMSLRFLAWLPLTAFLALALATPLPWARRSRLLILGVVLVHAFVALRIWLLTHVGFLNAEAHGAALVDLTEGQRDAWRRAHAALCREPTTGYVFAVVTWAALALWPRARASAGSRAPAAA